MIMRLFLLKLYADDIFLISNWKKEPGGSFFIYGLFYISISKTNINNIISAMADENKKVVHDIDQRIWQIKSWL